MKKVLPTIPIALGVFFIVAALLAQVWASDQLARTPLDVDTTTYLDGTVSNLSAEGELEENPAKAVSRTRVAPGSSDDVVVFENSLCLMRDIDLPGDCISADDPERRLVNLSEDKFATDRRTGLAVNSAKYVGEDPEVEHEGLMNKWPFGAEKKDYPVWDSIAKGAVNAVYGGTDEIDGLEVYKYKASTSLGPIDIAEGVSGTYYDVTEYWIEPITGQIINQVKHQERLVAGVTPVLILDLEFTEDQVADNVAKAEDDVSKLNMVSTTGPIILYVLGGLLLALGLFLTFRKRPVDEQA